MRTKKRREICPLCGKSLEQKMGSVTFPVKGKKIIVDNLKYQECVSCHEKVFGQDAQEEIERKAYGKYHTEVA